MVLRAIKWLPFFEFLLNFFLSFFKLKVMFIVMFIVFAHFDDRLDGRCEKVNFMTF